MNKKIFSSFALIWSIASTFQLALLTVHANNVLPQKIPTYHAAYFVEDVQNKPLKNGSLSFQGKPKNISSRTDSSPSKVSPSNRASNLSPSLGTATKVSPSNYSKSVPLDKKSHKTSVNSSHTQNGTRALKPAPNEIPKANTNNLLILEKPISMSEHRKSIPPSSLGESLPSALREDLPSSSQASLPSSSQASLPSALREDLPSSSQASLPSSSLGVLPSSSRQNPYSITSNGKSTQAKAPSTTQSNAPFGSSASVMKTDKDDQESKIYPESEDTTYDGKNRTSMASPSMLFSEDNVDRPNATNAPSIPPLFIGSTSLALGLLGLRRSQKF